MSGIADKLVPMLREHGVELPDIEWKVRRCMPSRAGKSCGAWLWHLWPVDIQRHIMEAHHGTRIGSTYPAKECAKGFTVFQSLSSVELELFPKEENT